jgi:hypothetical protein
VPPIPRQQLGQLALWLGPERSPARAADARETACAQACGANTPEPAWSCHRLYDNYLGRDFVFGSRCFEAFQREVHLIQDLAIDKLVAAFGTATIELPPHFLNGEFEMGDPRLATGDIGHGTCSMSFCAQGCSLCAYCFRLSVDTCDMRAAKQL